MHKLNYYKYINFFKKYFDQNKLCNYSSFIAILEVNVTSFHFRKKKKILFLKTGKKSHINFNISLAKKIHFTFTISSITQFESNENEAQSPKILNFKSTKKIIHIFSFSLLLHMIKYQFNHISSNLEKFSVLL